MEKKVVKKSKSKAILIFIIALVIFLFVIIGFLVLSRESRAPENGGVIVDLKTEIVVEDKFHASFPGCGLIYNDCFDTTCGLYFLCNEKKYSTCEIYDCGEEFGIGTEDNNGEIRITKELKVDKEKVEAIVSKCRGGSLSIEKQECVENKLVVNVSLNVGGECIIKNFMAEYVFGEENKFRSVDKFSDLGSNNYLLTMNNCDDAVGFIAVGEGGVSIR